MEEDISDKATLERLVNLCKVTIRTYEEKKECWNKTNICEYQVPYTYREIVIRLDKKQTDEIKTIYHCGKYCGEKK